jgi:hypothetical protein
MNELLERRNVLKIPCEDGFEEFLVERPDDGQPLGELAMAWGAERRQDGVRRLTCRESLEEVGRRNLHVALRSCG